MSGPEGLDFIRLQDDEIKAYHARFKAAAEKFMSSRAGQSGKVALFYAMHEAGTDYYRKVEHEILNRSVLTGAEYERWVQEWTGSVEKLIHGIPIYHETLREHRGPLGLGDDVFEPSPGTYRNVQAFYARAFPKDVESAKQRFLDLKLPVSGFSHPYMAGPHRQKSQWWHPLVSVLIVGLLFAIFVVGAQYVSAWLMGLLLTAVIVLLVIIQAVDLRKNDQLKEKPFVDLVKLALTRWISFAVSFKPKGEKK